MCTTHDAAQNRQFENKKCFTMLTAAAVACLLLLLFL